MRRIVLAALLSTLALPAWAANVEVDRSSWSVWQWIDAATVCAEVSDGRYTICQMQHAPDEAHAVATAKVALRDCAQTEVDYRFMGALATFEKGWCPPTRAYIKQRWGY